MVRNESSLDRVLRVALGMGLLALVIDGPRSPWGLFGLVPLLTGLVGICPTYKMFRFSSLGLKATPSLRP